MQNIVTWPYLLRRGHSDDPSQGACAMDAVNWLVHGRHGDAPECACPVIATYVRTGNDAMPDNVRQRLLPYLHRIAGSHSAIHVAARMRVVELGAVRIFLPRELDAAGLCDRAARLRNLPDDDIGIEEDKMTALLVVVAAARAAVRTAAWDDYFVVLDQALSSGPQGQPWSVDVIARGTDLYEAARSECRSPVPIEPAPPPSPHES